MFVVDAPRYESDPKRGKKQRGKKNESSSLSNTSQTVQVESMNFLLSSSVNQRLLWEKQQNI